MPRIVRVTRPVFIIVFVVLVGFFTLLLPDSLRSPASLLPSFKGSPNTSPSVFNDVPNGSPIDSGRPEALPNPHEALPIDSNPHEEHPIDPNPLEATPVDVATKVSAPPPVAPGPHLENATLFMLTSNWEIDGAAQVVHQVEDRFNSKFHYPWVFLNDEPFTDEFKHRLLSLVSGPAHFGQISGELWDPPPWINSTKAAERMEEMEKGGVAKGGRLGYHNMCRFNSGTFHQHPLLQNFRYYWRVEPEAHYHCDVENDPFTYLRENNKVYGFTLSMPEVQNAIEGLWTTVKDFIAKYPEHIVRNNAMEFLSDNGGEDYNNCLFFNNFEIADMDLWRGEAYTAFFDYIDRQGGFYYERWGDAPVHTIGAALFARIDQIHFFREIGYEHYPFTHCPTGDLWERGRCSCDPEKSFDYAGGWSCLPRWEDVERRYHEL